MTDKIEKKPFFENIMALGGFIIIFTLIVSAGVLLTIGSTPACDHSAIIADIEKRAGIVISDYEIKSESIPIGESYRGCRIRVVTKFGGTLNFKYSAKFWGADYSIIGYLRIKPKAHNLRESK